MGHYARACKEKSQTGYNTKNNERHLNYIGIHSSEGSRILDDESSSDEDEEKRFYPISTRSQKYGNVRTAPLGLASWRGFFSVKDSACSGGWWAPDPNYSIF